MGDDAQRYLPLYEAKMMHQFTHRWAGYGADGRTRELSEERLRDPEATVLPRYWVDEREVAARLERRWDGQWLLGWRDIARATDMRTTIAGIAPAVAIGGPFNLLLPGARRAVAGLLANLNSFVCDWVARQKIGGTHLSQNYMRQLPVLPPHCYTAALLGFINPRALELVYTAHDLAPFARELGYEGPPYVWDAERRFTLRCELDALYFHLYGLDAAACARVLDSFPIVRRKDVSEHGHYRTRDAVLANYEELGGLPTMAMPAPRDAGEALTVPDVRLW